MRSSILLLALFFSLSACGTDSSSNTSRGECEETRGISYRTDGQLTFFRGDSTKIREITIEVADTDSTRARGLMARKCLPEDWGMLFVFAEVRSQAFYMANTPRSLDIMYFAADTSFINAAKYTTPNSLDNLLSDAPAQFVVETPAGFVDRYGISPGDFISWALRSDESVEARENSDEALPLKPLPAD